MVQKGYNYKQLFISTHNLDFLKYLKRLSIAKTIKDENNSNKNNSEYFLIESINDKESKVLLMPDYLKNYITEFNYLFHQIYKCSKVQNPNEEHQCFYNFGNNLRKFLEVYLFYTYPETKTIEEKLMMFFQEDQLIVELAKRLFNELSHLGGNFDRSMVPIDIPEIHKLAKCFLDAIEARNKEQYDALLRSIDESV